MSCLRAGTISLFSLGAWQCSAHCKHSLIICWICECVTKWMNHKIKWFFLYQRTASFCEGSRAGKYVHGFCLTCMTEISPVSPLGNMRAGADGLTMLWGLRKEGLNNTAFTSVPHSLECCHHRHPFEVNAVSRWPLLKTDTLSEGSCPLNDIISSTHLDFSGNRISCVEWVNLGGTLGGPLDGIFLVCYFYMWLMSVSPPVL